MIFTDLRVPASGPTEGVRIAVCGMSPAKNEVAAGKPFVGYSGRILDDALVINKWHRNYVYVTNLVEFFVDDNDLFSVPHELLERERARLWRELDSVRPNILCILGVDTLHLLTCRAQKHNTQHNKNLCDKGVKDGITKWRGSVFVIQSPSGRPQKCIAMMHPSNFIRGQWRWLPVFRYVDVRRAVTQSSSSVLELTPRNAITGPSYHDALDYLDTAMQQDWVSIDYEGRSHISCLGIGSSSEAMCIPLNRVGSRTYWPLDQEIEIWKRWNALLTNRRVKKIAQNAAYEWIKSWSYGIYPTPLGIDTMHLHHCLYPDFGGIDDEWTARKRRLDLPGHGLAFITSQYTDHPFYKDDGRHWSPELGEEAYWRYNCSDVMVTYEAAMKMKEQAERAGLFDVYESLYRTTFEPALRIEWLGHPINASLKNAARRDTLEEIATLASSLEKKIGRKVVTKKGENDAPGVLNLGSSKQMQEWLTSRGFKMRLHKDTGKPTVDKDTLQMLYASTHDETLLDIMTLRQKQDFVNDILDQRLDEFNRMHCHIKLGGTNGTRWSTTESILGGGTNVQNLPRAGVARRLFLP